MAKRYEMVEERKLGYLKGMILDPCMLIGGKNLNGERERLVGVVDSVYQKIISEYSHEAFEEGDLVSEGVSREDVRDVMPFFRHSGLVSKSGRDGAYTLNGI